MIYWVKINKTGSRSLGAWMEGNNIPHRSHHYKRGKSELCNDIRQNPQLHFFCVVRNPWCRAISSWKFLSARESKASGPSLDVDFKNFLLMPYHKMTTFQRNHSLPQFDFICDNQGNIDYLKHIGKLENIKNTLTYITNTLNVNPPDLKFDFPHANKTKHKHYTEYYDDETREIVAEKYAKDIEYFGYEFGE